MNLKLKHVIPLGLINMASLTLMVCYVIRRYFIVTNFEGNNSFILIFGLGVVCIWGSFSTILSRNEYRWTDSLKSIVNGQGKGSSFSALTFTILSYLGALMGLSFVFFKYLADFREF